ncbi:MAG: hypothetical protein CMK89_14645 [Pseudomonadales bacterium]|nr:hypothetical protein [Pseudomonadales bacterium]
MSWRIPTFLLCTLIVAGCSTQPVAPPPTDPHLDQIRADFSQCREQAYDMDASAREQQSAAQYQTAAGLFQHCVETFSDHHQVVAAEDMLVLQAMSVMDYLKAGNVESAREQLKLLRMAFPHHDLYLSDGSSFVDSMLLLLEFSSEESRRHQLLNTNRTLAMEFKRREYWLQH